jgi:hypothetical protein
VKKISIKILAFFLFAGNLVSAVCNTYPCQKKFNDDPFNKSLRVGEELTYIVRYAFFNLGEVRFKIEEKTEKNGMEVLKTIAYIDSYEGVPFVNLHQIYNSYIDSSLYPTMFYALMLRDDTTFIKYIFDNASSIKMTKGDYRTSETWFDSTTYVKKRFQDGLSILHFARMNFGEEKTIEVPCFVNEKQEVTTLNYYEENEPIEIDAVDYEIDCVRLDGDTDFVSVYGLTGYFEGWFSNDEYFVPVKAKMNVIIGSVTLELKNWNKKLWTPPKYKE